jgi:hypothetical protein
LRGWHLRLTVGGGLGIMHRGMQGQTVYSLALGLHLGCLLGCGCGHAALQKEMNMNTLMWGPGADWCQISISVDRPSYKASDKIFLTVVLRNISKHQAQYQPFPFAPGVDYTVTLKRGAPVALTAFGSLMKDSAEQSSSAVESLAPGQDVVYEIYLNRQYDLTLAEHYAARVTRKIETADRGHALAVSNVVEFEIEEAE